MAQLPLRSARALPMVSPSWVFTFTSLSGSARPAITVSPLFSTRTTSKLGAAESGWAEGAGVAAGASAVD
ncbi:MAG: hypothetical protein Tsb0032_28090 [Kiloniellaceae bacterium]